ncbi:hypothetical protein [Pedobacter sp.]|jgi:hypothetical protein|uniref:hypothetical protein n=1 Tax=Pedobacter sp. TaxID=1411316 RepID=UPI002C9E75D2|nr:hypothetical protein [Pedobacter sp.]HWW43121.1 hypothetical protein [Pedobacter sp.]
MELFKPLAEFFSAIQSDFRISKTHIAIYSSLLQYWQMNDYPIPMKVFSHQIMRIAKIEACSTYHRCLKELDSFGYIKYVPSFKKNDASSVYLLLN